MRATRPPSRATAHAARYGRCSARPAPARYHGEYHAATWRSDPPSSQAQGRVRRTERSRAPHALAARRGAAGFPPREQPRPGRVARARPAGSDRPCTGRAALAGAWRRTREKRSIAVYAVSTSITHNTGTMMSKASARSTAARTARPVPSSRRPCKPSDSAFARSYEMTIDSAATANASIGRWALVRPRYQPTPMSSTASETRSATESKNDPRRARLAGAAGDRTVEQVEQPGEHHSNGTPYEMARSDDDRGDTRDHEPDRRQEIGRDTDAT